MKLRQICAAFGLVVLATVAASAAAPNDNFSNRIVLLGSSLTTTGYNVGATSETGEPNPFSITGSRRTVWWAWTAPTDGSVRMTTIGSTAANTVLAVYSGTAVTNLTLVASDNDSGGNLSSLVTFHAVANTQYQIQVERFNGTTVGNVVVNVHLTNTPPSLLFTSPGNNAIFTQSTNIVLSGFASDYQTTNGLNGVAEVDFYQGSTQIASIVPPRTNTFFTYTWPNVGGGSYTLTAVASNTSGLTTTSAPVHITVASNTPPSVSITNPIDGAVLILPANITIRASASDPGGAVTKVEFYQGTTKLGQDTTSPYSVIWSNAAAGAYTLTAVAYDNGGLTATSGPVHVTLSSNSPPTVAMTNPVNNAVFIGPTNITLSASASDSDGTVVKVDFFQAANKLGTALTSPYSITWSNVAVGTYNLTAVATDNSGLSTTSSVVRVTVSGGFDAGQIKTVFIIAMENHDWTQACPTCSPPQLLGNAAAPYVNSLVTPGHSNAVQVSYATAYYNVAQGCHPSEPNYVWSEAGTEFGVHTDNDPSLASGNLFSTPNHLSRQLTDAGIVWKDYQEDLEYCPAPIVSAVGTRPSGTNLYNGSRLYDRGVKHDPMQFFADTQNTNVYPLAQFWTDLTNNAVGRYNWITPDQNNDMHNALPSFTYHGVQYSGNQAAIAQGDNFLSIVVPKIMASAAYQDRGVLILWTDETESTDDTGTTQPFMVISPLAKGNAYASSVALSHSSTLKMMDEIFGLSFQTNAIGAASIDAQGTGYNYVDGRSAIVNDLSDLFQGLSSPPPLALRMAWLEGGQYSMSFAGNPGQSYALQFTESLTSPAWQTLVIITADSTTGLGSYVMTPSTNAPRQFHRLITPPP